MSVGHPTGTNEVVDTLYYLPIVPRGAYPTPTQYSQPYHHGEAASHQCDGAYNTVPPERPTYFHRKRAGSESPIQTNHQERNSTVGFMGAKSIDTLTPH